MDIEPDWEEYAKCDWDNYNIVLLKPYGGKIFGDTLKVGEGLYNTLINLKIGVSAEYFEEHLSDRENLVLQIKKLTEENKDLQEELGDACEDNFELRAEIEELKDFKYSNKMMTNIDTK